MYMYINRMAYTALPWTTRVWDAPPEYTMFMPLNRLETGLYGVPIPPVVGQPLPPTTQIDTTTTTTPGGASALEQHDEVPTENTPLIAMSPIHTTTTSTAATSTTATTTSNPNNNDSYQNNSSVMIY